MANKQLKQAALYIRVSTTDQAEEGFSLDAQEKTLRDYCKLKGYAVFDVYADRGISAKDMIHRPDFQRLMGDARAHKFEIILVWKLTRFSRNMKDLVNACHELDDLGVSLVSYSEGFDCNDKSGRMIRDILGVISQWEWETISENIRFGLQERAHQGYRTCTYLLGYDVILGGDMTINQDEAEIVKFVFDYYEKTRNILTVVDACATRGYRGKRGAVLKPASIDAILRNFTYCGYYSWKGRPISRGHFEPLISISQYNRVQKILKAQGKIYGRRRRQPLIFLPENEKAG